MEVRDPLLESEIDELDKKLYISLVADYYCQKNRSLVRPFSSDGGVRSPEWYTYYMGSGPTLLKQPVVFRTSCFFCDSSKQLLQFCDNKNRFRCMACHQAGDIVGLIARLEWVSRKDALEILKNSISAGTIVADRVR